VCRDGASLQLDLLALLTAETSALLPTILFLFIIEIVHKVIRFSSNRFFVRSIVDFHVTFRRAGVCGTLQNRASKMGHLCSYHKIGKATVAFDGRVSQFDCRATKFQSSGSMRYPRSSMLAWSQRLSALTKILRNRSVCFAKKQEAACCVAR
jgi:hypothetical protein